MKSRYRYARLLYHNYYEINFQYPKIVALLQKSSITVHPNRTCFRKIYPKNIWPFAYCRLYVSKSKYNRASREAVSENEIENRSQPRDSTRDCWQPDACRRRSVVSDDMQTLEGLLWAVRRCSKSEAIVVWL